VMDCVGQAPSKVFFADRDTGGYQIGAEEEPRIWSIPGLNWQHRNAHRPFRSEDMANWARLMTQLDTVDAVFGVAMDDVPPPARDVVGLRVMAEHTNKHVRVLSFSPEGAEAICNMRDVVGDKSWFSVGFTAHGPLRWTNLALSIFEKTSGRGIPATVNGEPMAGTSGPTTLAGAAAVGNAEILSGLAVNQILEPGRPCVYNLGLAHVFDMKTGIAVTGAPENHLLADVSAAMGRFYNLPSCSWVSTESMAPDGQAALEKGVGFLTHLNSGVHLIWGLGQLESELTLSPAQAVIDNEIVGYVRRYLRGVEVTPETLAVDVTRDVGIAGSFLDADHTFAHFRTEFFEPSLLFRKKRPYWNDAGRPTLGDAAEDVAEELMKKEMQPVLSEEQLEGLLEIERGFLDRI
ncbi:MAG: trimethylamine methyltransferase family protein, partial [Candidatus Latescibacteria bacterium]|nr:trimethylamine methyltransferase family protein [Candidatus Latescibacterota bacterium]